MKMEQYSFAKVFMETTFDMLNLNYILLHEKSHAIMFQDIIAH